MAGDNVEGSTVVYGKKTVESPNLAYRFQPNISGNVYSGGTHTAGNTNTITEHEVAVNAQWEHAENKAEVLDAAQQIAKAITAIEEYIDRNPTAVWTWDNHTYSSTELRNEIDKTQFVVTDKTDFDNGGVGSAKHGVNGAPNIDTVSAHSFASTNPDGYASANYADQGVMAMMLHELGHMTDAGFAETAENMRVNRLDHGTRSPYNYSEYWQNDENFAHDFEKAAAEAMHMNVSQYELTTPKTYGMWQPAREIYDWHHGIS